MIRRNLCAVLCAVCLVLLTACGQEGQTAFTCRDITVTDHMYAFWMCSCKSELLRLYNGGSNDPEFWDTVLEDGRNAEEYALGLLRARVSDYAVGAMLFKEYKLKISAETTKAIEDDIAEKTEYYDGLEALNTYLARMDINADILKDIYIMEEKYEAVYEYLYGDGGIEAVTQAELEEHFRNTYSRVEYILFYVDADYQRDENGNLLVGEDGQYLTRETTEEEKQAKKEKMQQALARLDAGEDFAAVKAEYDEYAFDVSYYENGFYLSADEADVYGAPMVSAAGEMEAGEYSAVTDSPCCYIVHKLPLLSFAEMKPCDTELLSDLKPNYLAAKYHQKLAQYYDDVTVDESVIGAYSFRSAYPNSLF